MIVIEDLFKEDLDKLKKENAKFGSKIWELIFSIEENLHNPIQGIGLPEKLKGIDAFSRRINNKHRLIYRIEDDIIFLISCYGHYDDK